MQKCKNAKMQKCKKVISFRNGRDCFFVYFLLRLLPWRSLAVYAFSLENVWADGFFYVPLHAEIEIINF
jgi:hypothetical protein